MAFNVSDRVERLEREVAGLGRQIAGLPWRFPDFPGTDNHFQIIRGLTTTAVSPADVAFQIDSIEAYEQYSQIPPAPLWVKAPADGVTLADNTAIWAIYRRNVLTFDPGSGSVQVDWLMFEPGSTNAPPLRHFELTATKTLSQNTATAKWLDHAGFMVGDNVTLHDPGFRFSGRTAAYYSGEETGFRGYALLRSDLAESPGSPRWEIVAMESFAEWCFVSYYGAGIWVLSAAGFGGGEWDYRRPGGNGVALAVADPASLLPASPAAEAIAVVRLANPDTTPPTYIVHSTKGGTGTGGLVTVLITTDIATATWNNMTGVLVPSVTECTAFALDSGEASYELGDLVNVENHDPGEGLELGTGEKYIGICTRNDWGRLVLHMITCRKLPS